MDSLILPAFTPGQLYLVHAPRPIGKPLLNEFVARVALHSAVTVIDGGGSCFDPLHVARVLRGQVEAYLPCLERVRMARAFTCHELGTILEGEVSGQEPIVILDFLSLLDDENVQPPERQAVFTRLMRRLRTLVGSAPVLVWVREGVLPHTQTLALQLTQEADQVFTFQVVVPEEQPRLF